MAGLYLGANLQFGGLTAWAPQAHGWLRPWSDEEQPDADASINAVVATVATPASDMNDCMMVPGFPAPRFQSPLH